MEDLLQGKSFHASIDEQIIFSQLDYNLHAVWSLLLACGYLRVECYTVDGNYGECDYMLSLTNKEVRLMFRHMIDGLRNIPLPITHLLRHCCWMTQRL